MQTPLFPVLRSGGEEYIALTTPDTPHAAAIMQPIAVFRVSSHVRVSGDLNYTEIVTDTTEPPVYWTSLMAHADLEATKRLVEGRAPMNVTALVLPTAARANLAYFLLERRSFFRARPFGRFLELVSSATLPIIFADPGEFLGYEWNDRSWTGVAGLMSRLDLLTKLRITKPAEKRRDVEPVLKTISSLWSLLTHDVEGSRKRARQIGDANCEGESAELMFVGDSGRCARAREIAASHCALSSKLSDLLSQLETYRTDTQGRHQKIQQLLALMAEEVARPESSARKVEELHRQVQRLMKAGGSEKEIERIKEEIRETRAQLLPITAELEEWERLYTLSTAYEFRIQTLQEQICALRAETAGPAQSSTLPSTSTVPIEGGLPHEPIQDANMTKKLRLETGQLPGTVPYIEALQRMTKAPFFNTPKARFACILGIQETATAVQFDSAYRRLSHLLHPDRLSRSKCLPACLLPLLRSLQNRLNILRDEIGRM